MIFNIFFFMIDKVKNYDISDARKSPKRQEKKDRRAELGSPSERILYKSRLLSLLGKSVAHSAYDRADSRYSGDVEGGNMSVLNYTT